MRSRRLSVIIPGYNTAREQWERCIASVLNNIASSDEVICVDDGSVEKPHFLQRFADEDNRIKVIFLEKNSGPAKARNLGLEVARGEFVTFIDSDDQLLPDIYDFSIKEMGREYDVACFGVRSVWVNEKLYKDNFPEISDNGIMTVQAVKRFLSNTLMYYVWNKIYRQDFLRGHNLTFEEGMEMGEDLDYVLKCVVAGAKWKMLGRLGIIYYKTHSSILSRYKPTYVNGIRRTMQMWRQYKQSVVGGSELLGNFGETTEKDLWVGEWDNIWRIGSPYSLSEKWQFLNQHKEVASGAPMLCFFVKRVLYAFLRRYLYIAPIQRWHIKRMYPSVRPLTKDILVEIGRASGRE